MVLRFAMEDIFQRVAKQIRDKLEVSDFGEEQEKAHQSSYVRRGVGYYDVLNPSLIGLPVCMPSRQTDGPCCPMYSLFLSPGSADSAASVSASVMAVSPSRAVGTKPYDVGMIAFGVSSPAYPARSVDVPMSSTRAETSSGRAERVNVMQRNPLLYVEHTASVLYHGRVVDGFPIESKIRLLGRGNSLRETPVC